MTPDASNTQFFSRHRITTRKYRISIGSLVSVFLSLYVLSVLIFYSFSSFTKEYFAKNWKKKNGKNNTEKRKKKRINENGITAIDYNSELNLQLVVANMRILWLCLDPRIVQIRGKQYYNFYGLSWFRFEMNFDVIVRSKPIDS